MCESEQMRQALETLARAVINCRLMRLSPSNLRYGAMRRDELRQLDKQARQVLEDIGAEGFRFQDDPRPTIDEGFGQWMEY